jgi:hypothetical protein
MSTPATKKMLDSGAVRARYGGKSGRTVLRWKKSGVLPPADQTINGRDYWWESTLEEHERRRVTEREAAGAAAE